MDYYNWQKIHKRNYIPGIKKFPEINFKDEFQRQAWDKLLQYCRPAELEKLLLLAKNYNKHSDSFRFPPDVSKIKFCNNARAAEP